MYASCTVRKQIWTLNDKRCWGSASSTSTRTTVPSITWRRSKKSIGFEIMPRHRSTILLRRYSSIPQSLMWNGSSHKSSRSPCTLLGDWYCSPLSQVVWYTVQLPSWWFLYAALAWVVRGVHELSLASLAWHTTRFDTSWCNCWTVVVATSDNVRFRFKSAAVSVAALLLGLPQKNSI